MMLLALAVTAISQRSVRNSSRTASQISENALRAHIKFLSDDRLEGRGTGARGGEIAALYIAEQFEAMGLKGAGAKGSFWQPASLVGVKADPKTELRINGPEKAEAFKFADDFVAFTGAQTDHVSVNADLVFVGYGIDAPEQKWNDYKGPAEDYRGKILVTLVNDPPVLILDEPTNALDAYQVIGVRALVRSLAGRRTVLVASHVLTEIERTATRVMILLDGRLLTTDAMREASHERRVRLRIGGPGPAILAGLRQISGVIDAAPEKAGSAPAEAAESYLVEIAPGQLKVADLVRAIVGQGFALSELAEVKPDLERVFLELTRRASAMEKAG